MKKYEVREFTVATTDGKNPIQVFQNLSEQDTELIAAFDTLEEAKVRLNKCVPSVDKNSYVFTKYLHTCYVIEENEYDEDGDWVAGGDWWESAFEETEDDDMRF